MVNFKRAVSAVLVNVGIFTLGGNPTSAQTQSFTISRDHIDVVTSKKNEGVDITIDGALIASINATPASDSDHVNFTYSLKENLGYALLTYAMLYPSGCSQAIILYLDKYHKYIAHDIGEYCEKDEERNKLKFEQNRIVEYSSDINGLYREDAWKFPEFRHSFKILRN